MSSQAPITSSTNSTSSNRSNNTRNGSRRSGNNDSRRLGSQTSFKGSIEKMNGHIFTHVISPNNQYHDYNRTVQEVRTYAAQEVKSPSLFTSLFGPEPTSPTSVTPTRLSTDEMKDEFLRWEYKEALKDHKAEVKDILDDQTKIYECILGQCTEQLKAKLQSLDKFEEKSAAKDCAWLLRSIKSIHSAARETSPFSLVGLHVMHPRHPSATHTAGHDLAVWSNCARTDS